MNDMCEEEAKSVTDEQWTLIMVCAQPCYGHEGETSSNPPRGVWLPDLGVMFGPEVPDACPTDHRCSMLAD